MLETELRQILLFTPVGFFQNFITEPGTMWAAIYDMPSERPENFFIPLLIVILLELPICLYYYLKSKRSFFKKAIVCTVLFNSITFSIMFFGFMGLGMSYFVSVLAAEAFAITSETFLHHNFGGLSLGQAFNASLLANFFSWQIAPVITYYVLV